MVIPVGDVNPTRRRAYVTVALILANAIAFLVLQPDGGCAQVAFLYRWAAIPRELLGFEPLTTEQIAATIGSSSCAATVGGKSVLLSAVTAMFLHANLAHLVGNMLFLWVFGNNVEDRLGPARYLAFYVGGGLVATFAFAVTDPTSTVPLLGASGAVASVLGAYLVLHPRALVHTYAPFPLYLVAAIIPRARITGCFLFFAIVTLPAWLVLGGWFALQLVSSAAPAAGGGVAYIAHVAGFVTGIVLLLVLDTGRRRRHRSSLRVPPPPPPPPPPPGWA